MQKAFDICLVFGKTVLPGISVFPTFPYSEKRRLNPRMLKREVQKQRFISQNHYTTVASLCIMQASASQNCNPTNSTRYRTTWLWLSGLFSFLHSLYDPCELTWPSTLPTKSKFYSMKPQMKSQRDFTQQALWSPGAKWEAENIPQLSSTIFMLLRKRGYEMTATILHFK